MAENKEQKPQKIEIPSGLFVNGILFSKTAIKYKNKAGEEQELFMIGVGVKGSKNFLTITVTQERFHKLEEMTTYAGELTLSENNGKTYIAEHLPQAV